VASAQAVEAYRPSPSEDAASEPHAAASETVIVRFAATVEAGVQVFPDHLALDPRVYVGVGIRSGSIRHEVMLGVGVVIALTDCQHAIGGFGASVRYAFSQRITHHLELGPEVTVGAHVTYCNFRAPSLLAGDGTRIRVEFFSLGLRLLARLGDHVRLGLAVRAGAGYVDQTPGASTPLTIALVPQLAF
jgi:hypothetical protein